MRSIYSIVIFVLLLMETSCKKRVEEPDSASTGSVQKANAPLDTNPSGSLHTAFDDILEVQDNELSITITKGRINAGNVQIFCVLKFRQYNGNPSWDQMERDLLCFNSAEDFIKARPEFTNSSSGTYFSNITYRMNVGIKLFCNAPKSKSSQDPMKCNVKPFLPIGKPGPSCNKFFSSDPPTRWGQWSYISKRGIDVCLGTLLSIKKPWD